MSDPTLSSILLSLLKDTSGRHKSRTHDLHPSMSKVSLIKTSAQLVKYKKEGNQSGFREARKSNEVYIQPEQCKYERIRPNSNGN
jgi:hypothetical protein